MRLFAWLALGLVAGCASTAPQVDAIFFDDFSAADTAALQRNGWIVRDKPGHPGIEGASWGAGALALVDDPQQPGNRLLRLTARTDGTPQGTSHAQLCHARKFFEGTYAARVRFNDKPAQGPDGDVVVQTFYAVTPLRFDFDPEYSELDWEYLPNGGWGDPKTRLYGVTWQTVSLHPWTAFNQPLQVFRELDGWHVLVMQAGGGRTRWYLDGVPLAEHGGRNYPVKPMAISFNIWYSPGGLLADEHAVRVYQEDVDWVLHARDRLLSPAEVDAAVKRLRAEGASHVDRVPAADPPLASTCDF
ncbi:MAG TPA: glycoside hydrolase family 16 protein [Albitalea sp.]|uniref:glycoside hydrolase family 16 protein n=1 Tax=Piscinibacter sp. TaxID=1903157 RepID=UPI002ED32CE0